LYADVSKFKVEFEKEVLIQDGAFSSPPFSLFPSPSADFPRSADYGKDVYLFDGLRKDENDVEFYYKEFCYKSVNIDSHDEKGSFLSFPLTFFAH
jgi:hypothetical protein